MILKMSCHSSHQDQWQEVDSKDCHFWRGNDLVGRHISIRIIDQKPRAKVCGCKEMKRMLEEVAERSDDSRKKRKPCCYQKYNRELNLSDSVKRQTVDYRQKPLVLGWLFCKIGYITHHWNESTTWEMALKLIVFF